MWFVKQYDILNSFEFLALLIYFTIDTSRIIRNVSSIVTETRQYSTSIDSPKKWENGSQRPWNWGMKGRYWNVTKQKLIHLLLLSPITHCDKYDTSVIHIKITKNISNVFFTSKICEITTTWFNYFVLYLWITPEFIPLNMHNWFCQLK